LGAEPIGQPYQVFPPLLWGLVRQRRSAFGPLPRTSWPAPPAFRAALSSLPSRTNRFVGQPLSDDTAERVVGALCISDPERDAVATAEVKFGHVAVEVALAAVLIDALMPRLKIEKKPSMVLVWI
jgi:hypothetical protein